MKIKRSHKMTKLDFDILHSCLKTVLEFRNEFAQGLSSRQLNGMKKLMHEFSRYRFVKLTHGDTTLLLEAMRRSRRLVTAQLGRNEQQFYRTGYLIWQADYMSMTPEQKHEADMEYRNHLKKMKRRDV